MQNLIKQKIIRLNVREDQYEGIKTECERLGISLSNYLRRAVELPEVQQGERLDLLDKRRKK